MTLIYFNSDFDAGSWPGPLANKDAVAGEVWLGRTGLLTFLETHLGLNYPYDPDVVRAAALVPAISSIKGFWSRSAEVDPFGTAKCILQWRDYLWSYGWRGQKVAKRLGEIADVTREVTPGIYDRLEDVCDHLSDRGPICVDEITTFEPISRLPHIWQKLFKSFSSWGTEIRLRKVSPVHTHGDLLAARSLHFTPRGDGSIKLIRTNGTLNAAHQVAAWLADLDSIEGTVIISPDSTLDEALYRFGLPVTGADPVRQDNILLQILPLTLSLAWSPPDPQRALELLSLPVSPVPTGLAKRLTSALHEYPAVNSYLWDQTIKEYKETLSEEYRNRISERLDIIFNHRIMDGSYPSEEINKRCAMLSTWARGRMGKDDERQEAWYALLGQIENFNRLIFLSGLTQFTAAQLRRLIQDATSEVHNLPRFKAQSGIAAVGRPGCIVGPAKRILWWSFLKESAEMVSFYPFSKKERSALADAGVTLPEPASEALIVAERWRRPLLLAQEKLIFICPQFGPNGDEQYPHPLWDEVVGNIVKSSNSSSLESSSLEGELKQRPIKRDFRPLPVPEYQWQVIPDLLIHRPKESANSLNRLISCPFQWVVQYLGKVWGGRTAALNEGDALEGFLIHEILARLLLKPPESPEKAAVQANNLFEQEGPRIAAQLFQDGNEVRRAEIKLATSLAAEEIIRLLTTGNFKIDAVEEKYSSVVDEIEIELEGYPDLVLKSPNAVIDFKRGGSRYRREQLAAGTYDQLSVYSHLVRGNKNVSLPPVAYYILKQRLLLTTDSSVFPNTECIGGPDPEQVWSALINSYKYRRKELDDGLILAPGNHLEYSDKDKDCIDQERLKLNPSCVFCDLDLLCGAKFKDQL